MGDIISQTDALVWRHRHFALPMECLRKNQREQALHCTGWGAHWHKSHAGRAL